MKPSIMISPGAPISTAGRTIGQPHEKQLKAAARKFEASFMTEMIRLARPSAQASGPFAPGKSEDTWRYFMDQALGQATVDGSQGDNGLSDSIEKALRAAEGNSQKSGSAT